MSFRIPGFEEESSLSDYALPIATGIGAAGLGAAALIRRNPWLRTGAKYHLAKDFGLGKWTPPALSAEALAARALRHEQGVESAKALAQALREAGLDPARARIGVSGISGSGKGWLSGALADELGMRHIELDPIVFGRERLDGAPATWRDKAKFWLRPSSNRLEEIYAEQGMPEGALYDYVNSSGWANPERYDALIHVDRPLEEIKQDLLSRGYGAFSPEILDAEGNRKITSTLFDQASGDALDFGNYRLKIKPEGGFNTQANVADALRARGDTDFGRLPLHNQASLLADPDRSFQPGWLDNIRWSPVAKATAGLGALGTATGVGTYAAQERVKKSAFLEDADSSDALLFGGGVAGLGGAAGLEGFRRALPDVTSEGHRVMDAFLGLDPEAAATDPRKLIDDYAAAGHNAVRAKFTPEHTGRTLIEELRTGRTARGMDALGFNAAWGPGSAEHYDAFLRGKGDAIEQLIRESDHPGAIPVKSVADMPDDLARRVAEETADKLRRYQTFLPKVQSLVHARPVMGHAAIGGGVLGAMSLAAGLRGAMTED